jgi:hypothetical protein
MTSSAATQHAGRPANRRHALTVVLGLMVGSLLAGLVIDIDAVRAAEPDELAIFLGYGPLQGPAFIDQYTLDGERVGRVELSRPASGIERRGDKLVVAAATFIVGGGRMLTVEPDGTIHPLMVDGRFGAPIALALDFATQDLIVSDNEAHAVSRVALSDDGTRAKISRLFTAPLTAGHEHFPSMSAAATTAGELLFSASDPLGIFRLPPGSEPALPAPLVPGIDAAVEADPTSPRWAAMLDNELVIYQGAEEQRRIDRPDNTMFWHYKVMTFGPDGRLYVVLQTRRGFEVQSVDVTTGQFTPHVVFEANRARCLAVGRRMPWKP